jgi:hypothetical protein
MVRCLLWLNKLEKIAKNKTLFLGRLGFLLFSLGTQLSFEQNDYFRRIC